MRNSPMYTFIVVVRIEWIGVILNFAECLLLEQEGEMDDGMLATSSSSSTLCSAAAVDSDLMAAPMKTPWRQL
jgi:hypothetical protein